MENLQTATMAKAFIESSTISQGEYTKLQQCQKGSSTISQGENIQNCYSVKDLHAKFHNFQGRSYASSKICLDLECHGYHTKIYPLASSRTET